METNLKRTWANKIIMEVCHIIKDKGTFGELPYLEIGNVDISRNTYAFTEKLSVKGCKVAKRGDVLISRVRPTRGAIAIVKEDNLLVSSAFTILRNKNILTDKYLFLYLVKNQKFMNYLGDNCTGTMYPTVGEKIIVDYSVPVAPLNEQEAIVKKLDVLLTKVKDAQSRLEKIPLILKRFRQSVLFAACSGHLTVDWRTTVQPKRVKEFLNQIRTQRLDLCKSKEEQKKFTDKFAELSIDKIIDENDWISLKAEFICDFITKGTTPKTSELKLIGDIPYIKVYNIVDNKIDFNSKPQFISQEIHRTSLKRSVVYSGDILMNIVGPPLGKVAIVPVKFSEWNINQALVIFRPIKAVMSKFIWISILGSKSLQKIIMETRGIAGQSNISLEQCRALDINVPSFEEQQEIVRRVELLLKIADQIEARYNKAKTQVDKLEQSILAKAFRGELVLHEK